MTERNPADVQDIAETLREAGEHPCRINTPFGLELRNGADEIERLRAAQAAMREALNAIIDRGPERDAKWFGMTAKDIACFALSQESAG